MAYQVLARKYRPQFFCDVIGQEHVTLTLLNALTQDRIAHGYIFSGHRGIGKTTVARILAMALNCRTPKGSAERPTAEPCGICDACTEIRGGNAVDVIEIDAATNRGIDEIRELREAARYSPARDRYKIYILDEAHQITDAAFNALLKTLEEPPSHVVFMMATTQPEDIPQTIRSRCQHFSFHAVRFEDITGQLRSIAQKEEIAVDEDALSLLAEAGDGSMRDALSIMDQAIASAPLRDGRNVLEAAQIRALMGTVSNQVFERMMAAVKEHDAASMLEQAAQLLDAGNSAQQIARQMVRFLRNCLMAKLAGAKSELLQVSDEERARAERTAAPFSEEDLTRLLNSMLRTFDDLNHRQEQRFHLELGLLKLVHMQRLLPFEELFRQLSSAGPAPSTTISRPVNSASSTAKAEVSRPAQAAQMRATAAVPTNPPANHPSDPLAGVFGNSFGTVKAVAPVTVPVAGAALPVAPVAVPAEHRIASTNPETSGDATSGDADAFRAQICAALTQAGQETVATLLDAGQWEWNGTELRVRAAASKILLDLAYTTQAQQIVRDTFRRIGGAGAVRVEAGQACGTAKDAETKRPAAAAMNAEGATDHPLVRRAQELFRAEVRSVVSLREPR